MVACTQGQAQTRAHTHRYQQSCRCGILYIPLSDFRSAAFSHSPTSCDRINKSHLVSCQQIKRIACKPTPHPNRTPPPQSVTPPFPPLLIFLAPQLNCNLRHPLFMSGFSFRCLRWSPSDPSINHSTSSLLTLSTCLWKSSVLSCTHRFRHVFVMLYDSVTFLHHASSSHFLNSFVLRGVPPPPSQSTPSL